MSRTRKGFTLVEVVISFFLLAMACLAVVEAIVVSNYTAAYARHKIQAIYFAQRALEEQRRLPFDYIQNQPARSFAISPDNFTVSRTIHVAPVTSPSGIDQYAKKVWVAVNWNENFYGNKVPAAEYCATDITNESQFN